MTEPAGLPPGHGSCSHFSLSNPRGRHEGNLPMLLRRAATEIAKLGPDAMILDLTLADEITANGHWFSVTVYYAPNYASDGSSDRR